MSVAMSVVTSVALKTKAYRAAKFLGQVLDKEYPKLRDDLSRILARLSPARHAPDFRSVRWYGTSYSFTPAQASIVSVLWQAWETGTAKVGAGPLLDAADLVSDCVSELFKGHSAWGAMICTQKGGLYWLQEPAEKV